MAVMKQAAALGRGQLTETQLSTAGQEWKAHWPLVLAGASGMSLSSLSTSSFGVMMVPLEQALVLEPGESV